MARPKVTKPLAEIPQALPSPTEVVRNEAGDNERVVVLPDRDTMFRSLLRFKLVEPVELDDMQVIAIAMKRLYPELMVEVYRHTVTQRVTVRIGTYLAAHVFELPVA